MGMVDIKGLDKAEVLHALWKHSIAQGLSFLGLPKKDLLSRKHRNSSKKDRKRMLDYTSIMSKDM